MKVVILCGGKGHRLREETEFRPKPMLPIGNRPVLWHIMKLYAHYGFREFILCLGYKGELIKEYFRNYCWNTCDVTMELGPTPSARFHDGHGEEDWTVTLADTGPDSYTAYRLKMVGKYLDDDEDFLFTYGDGVGPMDIPGSIRAHRESGKLCTLTAVQPPGRFGELSLNASSVCGFNEKPQVEGGYINGGYMVCNRRVLDYLPDDPQMMFEDKPLKDLTADGELNAFFHKGFWQPMDTYQELLMLNRLWDSPNPPWRIWSDELNIPEGAEERVASSAGK